VLLAIALAIAVAGLTFGMPTSKIVKRAIELDEAHHYKLSKILFSLACTRGNGEACADLAGYYYHYYHAISSGGITLSQAAIASASGDVENYTHAASLYSKACDMGYGTGCHVLAWMYEGHGLAKDAARAATLYSREADLLSKTCYAGDVSVCLDLAEKYEMGWNVARDYERAATLYGKACSEKAEACTKLGEVYSIGQGVVEDQSWANFYYAKACNAGDDGGCTSLALQYYYGVGTDRNMRRAVQLWNKACKMGDELACSEAAKQQ
jgi:TPR repeat protein